MNQPAQEDRLTDHVREFRELGYTVVADAFGEGAVAELTRALTAVRAKVLTAPESFETRYTSRDAAQGIDTWGVSHIFAPELYHDAFGAVFENPALMGFAHAVLGAELRFWAAHALWSPERVDYELNWHRDNEEHDHYSPTGSSTHVQFNVCLTDDASFRTVPGSHRRPLIEPEWRQVTTSGHAPLPGEVTVSCRRGDVLFMNHHVLHRGSCPAGRPRWALHMNLQARDEPTGGRTSYRFMRQPGYLDRMRPVVRGLMENSIAWDDAHPMSMTEMRRLMRRRTAIKSHDAGPRGSITATD
jgi:ectoine hydroxylase-related dioxygenase (phytanoyl-CoA dioxygenase family)